MTDFKAFAEFLGLDPDAKMLMVHADDAGLCHAENRATIEGLKKGVINSCSLMSPCPWFDEMATFLRENPSFDHGVHLTLTCEWTHYKFGPVAGVTAVPSLVDPQGYFWPKQKAFGERAKLEEVEIELRAQIDKCLEAGLSPSHLDVHMYSLGVSEEFMALYTRLGKTYGLPVLCSQNLSKAVARGQVDASFFEGQFCIENIIYGNFEAFQGKGLHDFYQKQIEGLEPGLNLILIHPAFDDLEMRAVAINHPNFGSAWRQKDFDFFTQEQLARRLKELGITLVHWGMVKDWLADKA